MLAYGLENHGVRPLAYRLFTRIVQASHAAREEEQGFSVAGAKGVIAGVKALWRAGGSRIPARATGGWYWVWRWRFEF